MKDRSTIKHVINVEYNVLFVAKHIIVSKLKAWVFCIMLLSNFGLFAQQNVEQLTTLLETKYSLLTKNIQLKKEYQTNSLIGTHVGFQCFYNEIELKDYYLKVHLDKTNKIYLIQENISDLVSIELVKNSFDKEYIFQKLKENSLEVFDSKEVLVLKEKGFFEKSFQLTIFNNWKDIYVERTYFSNTNFVERDLKVHFLPQDTTIKGSVFVPDPLTSAEEPYGGNYQDAFKKDTTALIAKIITNTGQTSVSTGIVAFSIYGSSFNLTDQTVSNSFSGSNIYFVLKDVYLDNNKNVLGYNAELVDDVSTYKTKLIIEDFDYLELNSQQSPIEVLGDFTATKFTLKNTVFEIKDFSLPVIAPYNSTTNDFSFNRSNKAFEEINIFYHLNNFHNYVESLGYIDLDPQKIIIDAHGNAGADNSFFTNAPTPRLIFGDGGIDDGEDASVVVHEYTHALSHFASPNTNLGDERKALDEALGDYFSSSYIYQYGDFNTEKVFPWDGHNEFWEGRVTNSDSTYKALDLNKSIYFNAQILSATFMDIFAILGKEITDKLVLETMYLNTSNNTFQDVANNLLIVDSLLFNNEHKCDIYNILATRKFKKSYCIGPGLITEDGFYVLNTANFSKGISPAKIVVLEENFKEMELVISNNLGKIFYKEKGIKDTQIILNPSDFSMGIYYIKIRTSNKKIYKIKLQKI